LPAKTSHGNGPPARHIRFAGRNNAQQKILASVMLIGEH